MRTGQTRPAVLTLVGGTVAAQVLGIIASPILTRLYSPVDFGEFGAVIAVVSLLATASSLSYVHAFLLPHDDVDAANLLVLSLLLILVTGTAFGVIVVLAGGSTLSALGAGSLANYGLVLAVALMGTASLGALKEWNLRTRSFRQLAAASLTQSGALVAAQLALGLASATSLGLLVGHITGSGAAVVLLGRSMWSRSAGAMRQVSWAGIRRVAMRYRRFAYLTTPSVFLNQLGLRAPLLLLTGLYGPATGGQYLLAERVVALPATLIAGSVGQVFTAQAAPLARTDPIALRRLYIRTTLSLSATAVIPTVLAIVLAPHLFGVIFGDAWAEAGVVVAILAPMYFALLAFSPTGGIIDILERQGLALIREAARVSIIGVAGALMVILDLSAIEAVVALSVSGTIVYVLYGVTSWWAITTFVKHPHQLRTPQLERPEEQEPPGPSL